MVVGRVVMNVDTHLLCCHTILVIYSLYALHYAVFPLFTGSAQIAADALLIQLNMPFRANSTQKTLKYNQRLHQRENISNHISTIHR